MQDQPPFGSYVKIADLSHPVVYSADENIAGEASTYRPTSPHPLDLSFPHCMGPHMKLRALSTDAEFLPEKLLELMNNWEHF